MKTRQHDDASHLSCLMHHQFSQKNLSLPATAYQVLYRILDMRSIHHIADRNNRPIDQNTMAINLYDFPEVGSTSATTKQKWKISVQCFAADMVFFANHSLDWTRDKPAHYDVPIPSQLPDDSDSEDSSDSEDKKVSARPN